MQRMSQAGLGLLLASILALGIYETTAKSPSLLGTHLPGWWATDQAERTTRWQPVTGFLPLDKILHESEEAIRFYAVLAGQRS
jgi:hypothetical protein